MVQFFEKLAVLQAAEMDKPETQRATRPAASSSSSTELVMLVATALQSRERESCLGQEHAEGASQLMTPVCGTKRKNKKTRSHLFGGYASVGLLKYGWNNSGRLSCMRRGLCSLVLREGLLSRAPAAPDDTSPRHSALLGPPLLLLQVLNRLC